MWRTDGRRTNEQKNRLCPPPTPLASRHYNNLHLTVWWGMTEFKRQDLDHLAAFRGSCYDFITEKAYMAYSSLRSINGIDTDRGRTTILSNNLCSMVKYRIIAEKVQTRRSFKTFIQDRSISMMSWWARWRLKLPGSPLFTQPFIQGRSTKA